MIEQAFSKMHGLGNDFVIIDATCEPFSLNLQTRQAMADRRTGIGFDQMLILEPPQQAGSDFHFRIFNANGEEAEQCGNGARCMARYIHKHKMPHQHRFVVTCLAGVITLSLLDHQQVRVDMGPVRFEPADIPFVAPHRAERYTVDLLDTALDLAVANLGNPHAVVQVNALQSTAVASIGAQLNAHQRFPEGVNVGFMQITDPSHIQLRVFERGTGETRACGSGACAAMVIGRRAGLLQERVFVQQAGGQLQVDWPGPGAHVHMTGPAQYTFQGVWQY